ncbi:MAG: CcdB family protein [Burkholderiaceae bacterium]|nr:CcdB family protein [Burkholderiaceae bacterium]
MGQFDVYQNPDRASRGTYPRLLDIQSDLLDGLHTTVVIPLIPASQAGKAIFDRLTPVVELDGESWIVLTPQMAGIDREHIGSPVASLATYRAELVAALDFLISGI